MIYEFTIEELKRAVIPVRAKSPDEAQKIFDQWYHQHTDKEPQDSTILDLLDNGYEGRGLHRSAGIPEDEYNCGNVMLPEEKDEPEEPCYKMHIRFADGSQSFLAEDQTLVDISRIISDFGQKYYLFPDGDLMSNSNRYFWLYAVLKDKPETWYEFNNEGEYL